MDSDQGKLFIGGISWETNEEKLKEYFQGYGEVVQAVVMRDKITGKPRGFGFVVFSDPEILDRVLQDRHVIDGRTVEAKRALSREEQQGSRVGNSGGGARSFGGGSSGNNTRTKKIFVGGLPPNLSEDGFRAYFEPYGAVTDVVIMYDQQTNRPRGFGFISFDSEDAVDRVLHKTFHDLNGKQVEVKRALPKDASGGGRAMGGGGGGGYSQNSNSFDGRMDSGRYMQSQNSGGGYPNYPSSGYNAPGYGYGPAANAMGYGYGNYGGANPGFGGPAAGGYGNPNAASSAGYGGLPNAQRNSWGSQVAAGYGWGAGGGAGTGSGGAGAGQSPSGASGYGNPAYGYGGYGGNEGAYGNQAAAAAAAAAYGAVGGRGGSGPNGGAGEGGSGYMGGGYGDGNGGNAGYGNPGWRSDGSQASGNYGGSYGGGSARQAQQ